MTLVVAETLSDAKTKPNSNQCVCVLNTNDNYTLIQHDLFMKSVQVYLKLWVPFSKMK